MPTETSSNELEAALRRVAELESSLEKMTDALLTTADTLKKTSAELATVRGERDKLRRAYEQLKAHLELLRRRIFLAKAERIDTAQLEIEFAETKAKLDKLAREVDPPAEQEDAAPDANGDAPPPAKPPKKTSKGSGRPNLRELDLPEERVEVLDPALETTAERIGFEESCMLGYARRSDV